MEGERESGREGREGGYYKGREGVIGGRESERERGAEGGMEGETKGGRVLPREGGCGRRE